MKRMHLRRKNWNHLTVLDQDFARLCDGLSTKGISDGTANDEVVVHHAEGIFPVLVHRDPDVGVVVRDVPEPRDARKVISVPPEASITLAIPEVTAETRMGPAEAALADVLRHEHVFPDMALRGRPELETPTVRIRFARLRPQVATNEDSSR